MGLKIILFLLIIGIFLNINYADCNFIGHDCRTHCCGQQDGMYMEDGIADMSEALSFESQGRAIIFNKGTQTGGEDICIVYVNSPNLNKGVMDQCISDCIVNAGCGSSPTSTSTSGGLFVLPPVCVQVMGEIIQVDGTAHYMRDGLKEQLTLGQDYCEGDLIETDGEVGTKVIIKFSDGNIRYVVRNSKYSLTAYEPNKYYEGVRGVVQVFSKDRDSSNEYDTIVGGITSLRAGFKVHSNVLFEIDVVTKVTVLEGEVEVIDLDTGEIIAEVNTAEQY